MNNKEALLNYVDRDAGGLPCMRNLDEIRQLIEENKRRVKNVSLPVYSHWAPENLINPKDEVIVVKVKNR